MNTVKRNMLRFTRMKHLLSAVVASYLEKCLGDDTRVHGHSLTHAHAHARTMTRACTVTHAHGREREREREREERDCVNPSNP